MYDCFQATCPSSLDLATSVLLSAAQEWELTIITMTITSLMTHSVPVAPAHASLITHSLSRPRAALLDNHLMAPASRHVTCHFLTDATSHLCFGAREGNGGKTTIERGIASRSRPISRVWTKCEMKYMAFCWWWWCCCCTKTTTALSSSTPQQTVEWRLGLRIISGSVLFSLHGP